MNTQTAEHKRLKANKEKAIPLEEWGPYLSHRQWGTVREDYSENGDAWGYFPHDHARSRAYRWGEDGIGGISDRKQQLCFAPAFWNGRDPILKERLFGLTNPEGNHGEDVKELYYFLDNVPTHYYMKYVYKYPHAAYPYQRLIDENGRIGKDAPEFEILDTGIFNDGKYFDIYIEYAKNDSHDIVIRIEIVNRGPEKAPIWVLPTLWFYNYWQYQPEAKKPVIRLLEKDNVKAEHPKVGAYFCHFPPTENYLFTENETNFKKLFNRDNHTEFVKDAFHDAIIDGKNIQRLKEKNEGTKFSPVYQLDIEPQQSRTLTLRLTNREVQNPLDEKEVARIISLRKREANQFYKSLHPKNSTPDQKSIQRQAIAGMLWNKQYYHYDVARWLNSSDGISPHSPQRQLGRNHEWKYLKNEDILSMPDNWEYPWYAAWDTAFHCITLALVDPEYAKHQLTILMREWYMNPAGQLPAYEWNFSDVNPPVHAFAAFQVYKIEEKMYGKGDIDFLKSIFQKLIINFTWWTNRKDVGENSIFEGGFLGLDNIGLFNRSMKMPDGTLLEQADGTAWMGMFALDMMNIALEIAVHDPAFEDTATKFYEHFVIIAEALNKLGLWDEKDRFFYDLLSVHGQEPRTVKVRSIVGLAPLFGVGMIHKDVLKNLPDFKKRMTWFRNYREQNQRYLSAQEDDDDNQLMLSLVGSERLPFLLNRLFDENEFLSPGGIRAVSKYYADHPYSFEYNNAVHTIHYTPGDSDTNMFGGNSNWRGPVWLPINYLLIHALDRFAHFYKDNLKVEYPTGSGKELNLHDASKDLKQRLLSIFEVDQNGERPVFGPYNWFYKRAENKDLILFHEYFHGDNRRGLGASHQTGWTGLVANIIMEIDE